MKNVSYVKQLCERCGSKKVIAKTWKENVPTLSGKKTTVEFSQIVCTNKTCQLAFDDNLAKETKKREGIRLQREEREKERKANAFKHQKNKARKDTSRI